MTPYYRKKISALFSLSFFKKSQIYAVKVSSYVNNLQTIYDNKNLCSFSLSFCIFRV